MNKVILLGNLTRDPEIRYTSGEPPLAIVRFGIAVKRAYRGKDSGNDTDFFNCIAFGKTAENINKFFTKGRKIALSGRLQTGSYDKDGQTVKTTDIVVEDFDFCGSRTGDEGITSAAENIAPEPYKVETVEDDGEDLPF